MAQESKKPVHAKPSIYAYYFHAIKEIGITYGYNIVLHGSLNRDLDLVAIAWKEKLGNVDEMIDKIAEIIGGVVMMQCRSVNNLDGVRFQTTHHGRKQYVININRDMNYRFNGMDTVITEHPEPQFYIDISVV